MQEEAMITLNTLTGDKIKCLQEKLMNTELEAENMNQLFSNYSIKLKQGVEKTVNEGRDYFKLQLDIFAKNINSKGKIQFETEIIRIHTF